jgi:hypothetical protein
LANGALPLRGCVLHELVVTRRTLTCDLKLAGVRLVGEEWGGGCGADCTGAEHKEYKHNQLMVRRPRLCEVASTPTHHRWYSPQESLERTGDQRNSIELVLLIIVLSSVLG